VGAVSSGSANQAEPVVQCCGKFNSAVKPFISACPLFRKFHELNKTAKLKGTNINIIPTLIGIICSVEIVQFEFANIKGPEIFLHMKLPTFRAAKLKGFTVHDTE